MLDAAFGKKSPLQKPNKKPNNPNKTHKDHISRCGGMELLSPL